MPALVAGIHVFLFAVNNQDVDGRAKRGHDENKAAQVTNMSITDPGSTFAYLIVNADGQELLVRKSCKALRFDAYWETEPVPDEDKPDMTLLPPEIPTELWDIMDESEKLRCFLADAKNENRKLKKQKENLLGVLIVVAGIGWTFMILYFVK